MDRKSSQQFAATSQAISRGNEKALCVPLKSHVDFDKERAVQYHCLIKRDLPVEI